jgi:hypothetical protein
MYEMVVRLSAILCLGRNEMEIKCGYTDLNIFVPRAK